MTKPLLLASQSNSGSTWFSQCIAQADPSLRMFPKEFFNPILNTRHFEMLSRTMGCELVNCIGHLARVRSQQEIDTVVERTWQTENYNFTKENYSAFCLVPLAKHFDVFFLFRDIERCFPPERNMVRHWYDCWFWSMLRNGVIHSEMAEFLFAEATNSHRRAVVGWELVRRELKNAAAILEAPVVDYETLITGDKHVVKIHLAATLPRLSGRLAEIVLLTRQPQADRSQYAAEWADALEFHQQFKTRFA